MATPSKLRLAMFKKGITIAGLARLTGVSKQYLGILFKTEEFTENMKEKISKALEVDKDKLF